MPPRDTEPTPKVRQTHSAVIAGVILCILFAGLGLYSYYTTTQARTDNARLAEEARLLREERASLTGRIDQLTAQLAQRTEELGKFQGALADAQQARLELAEERRLRLEEQQQRAEMAERLREELSGQAGVDASTVQVQSDRISVRLPNEILFASGEATITPGGIETLGQVSNVLQKEYPQATLRIVGHTDNEPIGDAIRRVFPTNWHLSAARAAAAAVVFQQNGALPPERIEAIGRGEFEPLAPNDSEENRARNRRIELLLRLPPPNTPAAPSSKPKPAPAPDTPPADAEPIS